MFHLFLRKGLFTCPTERDGEREREENEEVDLKLKKKKKQFLCCCRGGR